MITTYEVQKQLQAVEAQIAAAQDRADRDRLEGQRDKLLNELLDLEGAHDRRPVAVR